MADTNQDINTLTRAAMQKITNGDLDSVVSAGISVNIKGKDGTNAVSTSNPLPIEVESTAVFPLPTGAATAAKQPALGTAGVSSADVITVQGIASGTAQPISAAALPLPAGAATSAKQDAMTTALGSPFQTGGSIGNTTFAATQSGAWNITNVSGTVSLPTGAATGAKQDSLLTALGTPFQAGGSIANTSFAATQSGTWNVTNVSVIFSLPTGAATAAKQAALGTAGTASADVLSVQGITSMTPLKVDGSAVTQPVSIATAPALVAGSAVIGKVSIDQTTPGTTNNIVMDSILDGTSTTSSVSSATSFPTITTAGGGYVAFGFTAVGSANTIVLEGSYDNFTTSVTVPFWRIDNASSGPVTSRTPSTAELYGAPVVAPQMRVRVSVYGSGTLTYFVILKRGVPLPSYVNQVSLSVAGNTPVGTVNSGSADSGAPLKIGGKVNTAVQAFTNGNRADLQQTVTGATLTEEGGRLFSNIATNTTTTVKSGAGFLHTLTINTKGIGNTATVYDNTAGSGTKIATIDTTLGQATLIYNLAFATGLTIVTAAGTAADITVTYR